jgi:hypothetical protein
MAALLALAGTLALGGLFAWAVVRTPHLGLGKHPHASLFAGVLGLVVAIVTLAVLVGATVVFDRAGPERWGYTMVTYFLAMASRFFNGPYASFWTPRWMYVIGSLTPLIALGASLALVAGLAARPVARRTAIVIVCVASCLLVAYVAAGVVTAIGSWNGVPG